MGIHRKNWFALLNNDSAALEKIFEITAGRSHTHSDVTSKVAACYIKTDSNEANARSKRLYLAAQGKAINFLVDSTRHPILHAIFAQVYLTSKCLCDLDLKKSVPKTSTQLLSGVIAADDGYQRQEIERVYRAHFGEGAIPKIEEAVQMLQRSSSGRQNKSPSVVLALRRSMSEQMTRVPYNTATDCFMRGDYNLDNYKNPADPLNSGVQLGGC